jgi:hypothetical protein
MKCNGHKAINSLFGKEAECREAKSPGMEG